MRWVARSAAFPSLTAHAPRVTPLPLQIKDWSELDRVAGLPELQEVLFVGNPIYDGMDRKTAKLHVRRERGPAPSRASPTRRLRRRSSSACRASSRSTTRW